MKRENLLLWLNRYLTKRFIANPDTLPEDECENEAKVILDKVLKDNWIDKPDSEGWWWYSHGNHIWCYKLMDYDGMLVADLEGSISMIRGYPGKWSKAIVPEKE